MIIIFLACSLLVTTARKYEGLCFFEKAGSYTAVNPVYDFIWMRTF